MFELHYHPEWDIHFSKLDNSIRILIKKKINQLKLLSGARHLKHGLPYFVVGVNQYRIVFEEFENIRRIMFVGNHKQYEEWIHQIEI